MNQGHRQDGVGAFCWAWDIPQLEVGEAGEWTPAGTKVCYFLLWFVRMIKVFWEIILGAKENVVKMQNMK